MMGLLYEPRKADERMFIGREVAMFGDGLALMIVETDGKKTNDYALLITSKGIMRSGGWRVGRLQCEKDGGCIALHPDDPAMRRIRELESRVQELEAAAKSAPIERTPEQVVAFSGNTASAEALELTDEKCRKLWRVLQNAPGSDMDAVRALIAAYKAMRPDATEEDVEKLASKMYEARASGRAWEYRSAAQDKGWRRVARTVLGLRA